MLICGEAPFWIALCFVHNTPTITHFGQVSYNIPNTISRVYYYYMIRIMISVYIASTVKPHLTDTFITALSIKPLLHC